MHVINYIEHLFIKEKKHHPSQWFVHVARIVVITFKLKIQDPSQRLVLLHSIFGITSNTYL